MSEPYQISITKAGDAIVCSIDLWQDVQEKIDRLFAERMEEEAVRQLREIGFERVVRCRDCRHYTEDEMEYYHFCGSWCEQVEPDGFCAWGERRRDA